MSLFSKLRGTIESVFQIGITSTAILLKNVSGKLALRNKADSAYINAQVNGLEIFDSGGTNKVTITQGTLGGDITLVLPTTDGSAGQVLQTDGAGTTTWASAGTTSDLVHVDTTTLAFGDSSPKTLFTLPANAVIHLIKIIVDIAFNGTAPTVSIGISGTVSKYVGTGDVDLKTANVYEIDPGAIAAGGTEALIATYSADSSSAGSARIEVYYSNPT